MKFLTFENLSVDFKYEFVDDVYEPYEDRDSHPWYKYRRGVGVFMCLFALFFLTSIL